MSFALCLIALGFGYRIFLDACKEKEGLKITGQAIGIAMMIGALLCGACSAARCAKLHGKAGCHKPPVQCLMEQKGQMPAQ